MRLHIFFRKLRTRKGPSLSTGPSLFLPPASQVCCLARELCREQCQGRVLLGRLQLAAGSPAYQLLRDGYLDDDMIEELQRHCDVPRPGKEVTPSRNPPERSPRGGRFRNPGGGSFARPPKMRPPFCHLLAQSRGPRGSFDLEWGISKLQRDNVFASFLPFLHLLAPTSQPAAKGRRPPLRSGRRQPRWSLWLLMISFRKVLSTASTFLVSAACAASGATKNAAFRKYSP